jgi:hypothetical protein
VNRFKGINKSLVQVENQDIAFYMVVFDLVAVLKVKIERIDMAPMGTYPSKGIIGQSPGIPFR